MINTEFPRIPDFRPRQNDEIGGLAVDFIPENGLMFVIIANYESFPLRECKISFSETLPTADGEKLNHLNIFKNLTYLSPGRKIRIFTGNLSSFLNSLREKKIVTVTIKYQLPDGKKTAYSIKHNLSIYDDLPQIINEQNHE
ncbi:MAG: hypothetical protein U5K72_14975 [Balneolaceae bacterium]|nr:hypothetical protein [Balneolaceae bacterium]